MGDASYLIGWFELQLSGLSLPKLVMGDLYGGMSFLSYFLNVYLFLTDTHTHTHTHTHTQNASRGGAEREREMQNPKQAPGSELSAQSPTRGSNPRTVKSGA